MKINTAKSAGFCFGVKRAIRIAIEASRKDSPVEMLGDIVHNEDVVEQISKTGIIKVDKLTSGRNRVLLIRAHGAARATHAEARRLGYTIVDATCPMVKEIHAIAEQWDDRGYTVIVIGDKKHDEVYGILGHLGPDAVVVDRAENIPAERLRHVEKAAVVVQSTQRLENALEIVNSLKAYIPEVRFFNTICKPTMTKQKEIKTLPVENDLMIVIGSRTSANTRRLYEISKSLNPNSYWVQGPDELEPMWLCGAETIGVTAGASTPERTIESIIKKLQSFSGRGQSVYPSKGVSPDLPNSLS